MTTIELGASPYLYTWVDIEDRLRAADQWPPGLAWARAYWDGLTLAVVEGADQAPIVEWLRRQFPYQLSNAENALAIILESEAGKVNHLPVVFEAVEPDEAVLTPSAIRPTFARPAKLRPPAELDHPPARVDFPPVIAFHSFKGGVGRTTHAVALAQVLSRKLPNGVLLIDADLEAPGLTLPLLSRFPTPDISFADFVALVHGDEDTPPRASIALAAERVRAMRAIAAPALYVLPAFRTAQQFRAVQIQPEDVARRRGHPFILSDATAELGRQLGVGAVIIDLRAGFSEFAASFLLDPRTYRVFVTTLSSQSRFGTAQMLSILATESPSRRDDEPFPAVIISQVPLNYLDSDGAAQAEASLRTALAEFDISTASEADEMDAEALQSLDDLKRFVVQTKFEQDLQVLPNTWDAYTDIIRTSSLSSPMARLLEWIPMTTQDDRPMPLEGLKQQRETLRDTAKRLIFAETAQGATAQAFLRTPALRRLALDFTTKLPIAVAVGAKGAGKTYTFLQMAYRQTWERFLKDALEQEAVGMDSAHETYLLPALASRNLGGMSGGAQQLQACAQAVAAALGVQSAPNQVEIDQALSGLLARERNDAEWADVWLDVIAWRAGYGLWQPGAGSRLIGLLNEKQLRVVAIIDGLEDTFQNTPTDAKQQQAIRVLIQDVPRILETQARQSGLGLIVFIRQDFVQSALRQNANQLLGNHEPYSLQWDAVEALRLVAWTAQQAGVKLNRDGRELHHLDRDELSQWLEPVWGRKLGQPDSREAKSSDWVIAALSDFLGQTQARDVMRFIERAANGSVSDGVRTDRLLTPTAVRRAVGETSREKISETEAENPILRDIFVKLKALRPAQKTAPFATARDVELDQRELDDLVRFGVVARYENVYYFPEIYRAGLGFKLDSGARPRVIALQKRRGR